MPTILSFLNCKYLDVENCRRNVINIFFITYVVFVLAVSERGGECVCISLCVSKILSLCVGIECV